MKTKSISNITTKVNNITEMQKTSEIQKSEIDKIAEDYANSILRFVYRAESYMDSCGGMYYA